MYIDSFLKIGNSHQLLEDSVVVGDNRNPYIIVSDGCSGSEWTHLGSNILTRMAEKIFLETGEFKIDFIIHQAQFISKNLGLKDSALDATLMFAFIKNNKIHISVYGDGCVFYQQNNDKVSYSLSYKENMPYYLSYKLDNERATNYQEKVNKDLYDKPNLTLQVDKYVNQDKTSYFDTYFRGFHLELDVENLKYLILSSDGIESFSNQNLLDVFNDLHSFKNFKGDFLSRRIKRIIKEKNSDHIVHFDDIGMAGFSFEEGSDE